MIIFVIWMKKLKLRDKNKFHMITQLEIIKPRIIILELKFIENILQRR